MSKYYENIYTSKLQLRTVIKHHSIKILEAKII